MAPVTRRAAGSDAAAATSNAPQEGSAGGLQFGRLVVGETDEYDAPPPAPRLHAALLVVAVLPLCVDVPASVAIVATATLAILAGAWRSIKAAPPTETMTQKDAMRFPLIGRRVSTRGWRRQQFVVSPLSPLTRLPPSHAAASCWASSSSSNSCPKTW